MNGAELEDMKAAFAVVVTQLFSVFMIYFPCLIYFEMKVALNDSPTGYRKVASDDCRKPKLSTDQSGRLKAVFSHEDKESMEAVGQGVRR